MRDKIFRRFLLIGSIFFLIVSCCALFIQIKLEKYYFEITHKIIEQSCHNFNQQFAKSTTPEEQKQIIKIFSETKKMSPLILFDYNKIIQHASDESMTGESILKILSLEKIDKYKSFLQNPSTHTQIFYSKKIQRFIIFYEMAMSPNLILFTILKPDSHFNKIIVQSDQLHHIIIFIVILASIVFIISGSYFSKYAIKIKKNISEIPKNHSMMISNAQCLNQSIEIEDTSQLIMDIHQNAIYPSMITNAIQSPILFKDTKGTIIGCNKSFLQTFDFQYKQVINKMDAQIFPVEIVQDFAQKHKKIMKTKSEIEGNSHFTLKNKHYDFRITHYPLTDHKNQLIGLFILFLDTSRQIQIRNDCIKLNKQLKDFFYSIHTAVVIIEQSSLKIINVNQSAIQIFNLERDQIINQPCSLFLCHLNNHEKCPFQEINSNFQKFEREITSLTHNQKTIMGTINRIEINEIKYILYSFIDITTQKQQKQKLEMLVKKAEELNTVMLKRENQILQLKEQINQKYIEKNKPPPYNIEEDSDL